MLTYADLHGGLGPGPLTLRAAVERLERIGCAVSVEEGRAFVHAGPGTTTSAYELAAVVYAAEAAVVAAVGSGPVDPAKLPDAELTPAGALLREGMTGR